MNPDQSVLQERAMVEAMWVNEGYDPREQEAWDEAER